MTPTVLMSAAMLSRRPKGPSCRGPGPAEHEAVFWRRREPVIELPLDRDDVLAIFDALVDIKSWTREIWLVVVGEDLSDEDES
jgi:hypothetical protein